MYRRPRFLEVLHSIREDMSREADYDVDLFAEMVRSGKASRSIERNIRGFKSRVPRVDEDVTPHRQAKKRKARGR
jgi:hypothetical protein